MLEINTPIQYVKGVGPKKAEALAKMGVRTVFDLLLYLPFRYEDRSRRLLIRDVQGGQEATVEVEIESVHVRRTRRANFKIVEAMARDESGRVKAVWFNQDYLKETLTPGRRVLLYGKFERTGFGLFPEVKSPQYELVEEGQTEATHAGRIVPVYERIGPMSPKILRNVLHFLVMGMPRNIPELLPEVIRRRLDLPSREQALAQVHFPEEGESLELYRDFRSPAQQRLIFEELFVFFLGVLLRKRVDEELSKPHRYPVDDRIREIVRKMLPFRLTGAQRNVLKTISEDLSGRSPMRRLVQGDVGSGKTIVAVLASVIVMENGGQVAFMVPTELLAEQHFESVRRLLEPAGYRVALLSSRLKKAERESVLASIAANEVHLVVGTHALIQQDVHFSELGLTIIDEQHRFGVLQRAQLQEKSLGGDLMVMTATPIPRSLTMTLHGTLDLSVLDELPPGRSPIHTVRVEAKELKRVFRRLAEEIQKGHQIYFVCPLVEESEKSDLQAAVARFDSLRRGPFRDRRVALVHGRLSSQEREQVMDAFGAGKVDILVATTVVEVGVDVPNATVMVIEHADRFGLSQLHQLRGRVGRGSGKSTAFLVTRGTSTPEAEQRLQAMVETNDGFEIAERDLEIRGPGDFFGTRQSGLPLFRIANPLRDGKLLEMARREAAHYLASGALDDSERASETEELKRQIVAMWGEHFGLVAAG